MPFLVAPIAGLLGGGIAAQLLVGTALYVGGTLLSQALAPKPPKQKDPGVSLSMQMGGDSPLSFFVGTSATAGHRVYAGTWGTDGETPNAYFVDVLELANAPLDGLNNIYVNGELATVRWGEPHSQYGYPINQGRKSGKDHLWVKFHDGRQTAPDAYLRSKFGNHAERPYGADMVGRGTAYAIVTTRYNRELWQNGAPSMLFEVRGLRLYDIRKDSSAGGVGTHRRDNPSTWEWTDNPYVIAYNAAFMGVYVGSEWLWGLQGLPALRLPTSAWIAAMNESDRAMAAWGNQKQFTIGGEITVDMEPAAVLEEIAKSSMGRFIESAGTYKPRCGAPGAAVWSFGEGELLITDPRSFTPFPGLEATHNTIEATYSEPGEAWGNKAAPVQSDPAYIVADGNRRLAADLALPMVNRNEQAQRLAYSYLEDGRRFRTLQGSFHPITWLLEPGDVIEGTLLGEGYSGKSFEILEMSGRRTFVQTMTLREIDPADFDPPSSARQDWSVGPIQTIYPPAQVVTGWAVSPYEHIDSQNRARRPGIQCFYQGGMDDIRDIKVMIRRSGETSPFFSQPYPYDADNLIPSVIIVGDLILGNEPYEVASIFVPYSARDMEMSDWLAVTTPDIRLSSIDIQIEEIIEATAELSDWATRETRETIERLRSNVMDDGLGASNAYADRQKIRRELVSITGQSRAEWQEDILVATGPESAIALRIEELRTEVFDPVSGLPATNEAVNLLSSEIGVINGELVAQNNAILALDSAFGDISADFLFRAFTMAAPSGALARVALSVSATSGGLPSTAALFLDAMSDGKSRVLVNADQFAVTYGSGTDIKVPFAIDGGDIIINAKMVGSSMHINPFTGFFSFG
ncbi:MAG TPA: phage tail protein [Pelagibacterium sp.]|uniref:phage tail protein n=1 Tax=Pelagibacterium sp. TaxID=1967288 RepID=UPI002B53D474|nr:phage tail protein [Pelagibacterium sp.]HWJ88506.1 phage tail protein [Pelagibacterium sp.]